MTEFYVGVLIGEGLALGCIVAYCFVRDLWKTAVEIEAKKARRRRNQ